MGRTNHRRSETAPFTVRLSPGERAVLDAKAARFGLKPSDFVRAAISAYVPERPSPEPADRTGERNTL